MGNQPGQVQSHSNPADRKNITRLNQNLRRTISHTGNMVQMKILIRGASKTGKSALWNRLCGNPFPKSHIPTKQIQNGTVHWKYEETPVLISVWDVADRDASVTQDSLLKLTHKPKKLKKHQRGSFSIGLADSTTIQVYKDCCAVLFLIDPSNKASITYVEKMIMETPADVDILILRNFADIDATKTKPSPATNDPKKKHIPIDKSFFNLKKKYSKMLDEKHKDVKKYVSAEHRIFLYEISVKNGFGLQAIHAWLKLPYLRYCQKVLEKQLSENKKLQKGLYKTLSPSSKTDSLFIQYQDYPKFLTFLDKRAKSQPNPVPTANSSQRNGSSTKNSAKSKKNKSGIDPSFFDQEDDLDSFLGIEDRDSHIQTQAKKIVNDQPDQIPERMPTPDNEYFDNEDLDTSWAESETTPVTTPVSVPKKSGKSGKKSIFQEPEPEPESAEQHKSSNLLQIAAAAAVSINSETETETETGATTTDAGAITNDDFSPMPSPIPSPAVIATRKSVHKKHKGDVVGGTLLNPSVFSGNGTLPHVSSKGVPESVAVSVPVPVPVPVVESPIPQHPKSKRASTLLMASKLAAPVSSPDVADSSSDSSDSDPEFDFANSSGDEGQPKGKSKGNASVFTFKKNPLVLDADVSKPKKPKTKTKKKKSSKKNKKKKTKKNKKDPLALDISHATEQVTEDFDDWLS